MKRFKMSMPRYTTPGVYVDHVYTQPAPEFRTGVPVFVGLVKKQDLDALNGVYSLVRLPDPGLWLVRHPDETRARLARDREAASPPARAGSFYLRTGLALGEQIDREDTTVMDEGPEMFTLWPDFVNTFGGLFAYGYLGYAVHGFFANDGRLCYVQLVAYDDTPGDETPGRDPAVNALQAGLQSLEAFDDFDLVCAPDIMWPRGEGADLNQAEVRQMQVDVLKHCHRQGDRFAILDALPGASTSEVGDQQKCLCDEASGALTDGALYYPWVLVEDRPGLPSRFVPPCGHVAGVIARTDLSVGAHKAPANEILEGVLDLEVNLTDAQQGPLNVKGINCLRAFPGRGIRVWGARTLSREAFWRYVNVRRLFLTAGRWIERNMEDVVFEPQTPRLWARIVRDLSAYFTDLLRNGALKGTTPQEAFYVKCDAELNPPEVREAGMVITEVGLAAAVPAEFIVVRLIHGPTGLRIIGPS
jgi:hypothetical protein